MNALLLRNAAWNYAGTFFEGILGLAIVAFVVRHLGMAEYGQLVLALAIAELLLLCDFGLLSVLTQGLVAARARGKSTAFSRLFGAALLAGSGLGMLCALLLAGGFVVWSRAGVASEFVSRAPFIVLTAGGIALFALPGHVIARTHEALHAYPVLGRTNMILAVVRALSIVAVIAGGGGLAGLGAVYVGHAAARLLLLAVALAQVGDPLTSAWRRPDWSLLRRIWRPGGHALLDNTARQVAFGVDTLVLSVFSTMGAVAIFGVGRRIPVSLWLLVEKGVAVVLPAFSQHQASGDTGALRELFVRTCRWVFVVILPAVLIAAALAEPIVRLWVGDDYTGAVAPMRWLLVATLALALSVPAITLLYATNRIGSSARIAVAEGIANLALSLLLVGAYGASGVAAATALTHLLFTIGWLLPTACRAAGVGVGDLARLIVADSLAPTIALVPALVLVSSGAQSIPGGLRGVGICVSLACFLLYLLRADVFASRRTIETLPTKG